MTDPSALRATLAATRAALLEQCSPEGPWHGHLSSSALSTATATFALAVADRKAHEHHIGRGLAWLAESQNGDGGWGDTPQSPANLSTTLLAWSAFGLIDPPGPFAHVVKAAEGFIAQQAASLQPADIAAAVDRCYGQDRTFSAPILTMCALAGRLGRPDQAWRYVYALPFEVAALNHRLFKWLRLPVVSYALPALIAIGQAAFHHKLPRSPLRRALRNMARRATLAKLAAIQPDSGGFLEAAPLTSFVLMSLASIGQGGSGVAAKAVDFLLGSVRPDGSWPIDTNLATWVTTLSVGALAAGGDMPDILPQAHRDRLRRWLVGQQYQREHPYTHSAPGGWAWTDRSGGVPDADDTAGAMVALHHLADKSLHGNGGAAPIGALTLAATWLLDLANADGGIPTFCRGWGRLPFDRSSPDLTAHALLAWRLWQDPLTGFDRNLGRRMRRGIARGLRFLQRSQRDDGSWVPLWFGSQYADDQENPLYGTARVLLALAQPGLADGPRQRRMLQRGLEWLLAARNDDGGWGAQKTVPSTIEETALAVDALAKLLAHGHDDPTQALGHAVGSGVDWLIEHTRRGQDFHPAPIGLYFAKLWYWEKLYPIIFTASALARAAKAMV